MKLPLNLFLDNICARKVYYFRSNKLNTEIPHYHICIHKSADDIIILVCATSQFEKRKKFIEFNSLPFSTLVWIKPTDENGFKKDTYVDCNSCFDFTVNEFIQFYNNDSIEMEGKISDWDFVQILNGLLDSPQIEEHIKIKIRTEYKDIL